MRFAWLTGWATSPQATARLAQQWCPGEHHVVVPHAQWQRQLAPLVDDETVVCGYSTGAYLLLREPWAIQRARETLLFAPFVHLTSNHQLGGLADPRVLREWLNALPENRDRTLRTFWRWVGLPRDPEVDELSLDTLRWGLTELLQGAPASECTHRLRAWVGSEDRLVDGQSLAQHLPQLSILQGTGHALRDLLALVPEVEP